MRPGVWTTVDGNGHPIATGSIYGTQNGTNYANAWNGITSVIWGVAGVNTGDELYVCGTHVFKYLSGSGQGNDSGINYMSNSAVTIRGDYPSDPGIMFGGMVNYAGASAAYVGPDANGVYNQKLLSGLTLPPVFYFTGTNFTRLKHRTVATWTDGLGGQFLVSQTNYIQLPDGSVPTTNNMAQELKGWGFDLNNKSNIVFQSIQFISPYPGPQLGSLRIPTTSAPWTTATRGITFTNCTFTDSQQFYLYPGQDNFSFYNCEFGRMSSCIYSLLNSQTQGANRLTVSGCWLHDTGTTEYNDGDQHAIGLQGGNFHVIDHNISSNTGPAFVLWTAGSAEMKSNTLSYNFVINTHTNTSSGSSEGISIGGDNVGAPYGKRTGNKVYGNIIRNSAVGTNGFGQGIGIASNSPDYTEVFNNTIYGGNIGINVEVAQANGTVNGYFVNNLIVSPALKYFNMAGNSAPTNLTVDFNVYWPAAVASLMSPSVTHDANSLTNNPVLVSATPALITDFAVTSPSPAIRTGIMIGAGTDILGVAVPFGIKPDIGASQYPASASVITKPVKARRGNRNL